MNVKIDGEPFEVQDEPSDFWGWVANGHYNREWKIIRENVTPEHTFVDLGAWIGSHSLFASRIAKRVLAVEPDPVAFEILMQNAFSAPIEAFPFAIGDEGVVTLGSSMLGQSTTRLNKDWGGTIGPWAEGQTCEAKSTTLRKFLEDTKVSGPLFIKIDVEGAEEIIIKDLDLFKTLRPTVYMELHPLWWKDPTATEANLRQLARIYGTEIYGGSCLLQ